MVGSLADHRWESRTYPPSAALGVRQKSSSKKEIPNKWLDTVKHSVEVYTSWTIISMVGYIPV